MPAVFHFFRNFCCWTTACRLLKARVTGPVPWLFVVPLLATLFELLNLSYFWLPNFPIFLFAFFVSSALLFIAQQLYNLRCPKDLLGVVSHNEWEKLSREKQESLSKRINDERRNRNDILNKASDRIEKKFKDDSRLPTIKEAFLSEIEHLLPEEKIGEYIQLFIEARNSHFQKINQEHFISCCFVIIIYFASVAILIPFFLVRVLTVVTVTFPSLWDTLAAVFNR